MLFGSLGHLCGSSDHVSSLDDSFAEMAVLQTVSASAIDQW